MELIDVGYCNGDDVVFGIGGYGEIVWAPILVDILSKKVDKLCLKHANFVHEKEEGRLTLWVREFHSLVEVSGF